MPALRYDNFMAPYKGNSAFNLNPKLNEYKTTYFEKYASKILVSCVYNNYNGRYTFFFKIPSGENDNLPTELLYDVIIEFNPPGNKKKDVEHLADLQTYDVYIFSNSPSFIFTFDYVIKQKYGFPHCINGSFLSTVAITKAPVVRNTFEIMTIEKTTWMCFFHLVHNGYLTKEVCKTLITTNKNESFYLKNIASQPAKLKEIKDLKEVVKQAKKKEEVKAHVRSLNSSTSNFKNSFDKSFKTDFNVQNNRVVKHIKKRNDLNIFKSKMFTSFKTKGDKK